MSWIGLRHKGTEVLYSWEWNRVVDGLDILYAYIADSVKFSDLPHLPSDVAPAEDRRYRLGYEGRRWEEVHGYYGYFDGDLYARGSRVLVDGDPVRVYEFIGEARQEIECIYNMLTAIAEEVESTREAVDLLIEYTRMIYEYTRPPTDVNTYRLLVGSTPIPISQIDTMVKRIHVKVPPWSLYIVYIGGRTRQDFVLSPGDEETLEVNNPHIVYVRSLGTCEIQVLLEV